MSDDTNLITAVILSFLAVALIWIHAAVVVKTSPLTTWQTVRRMHVFITLLAFVPFANLVLTLGLPVMIGVRLYRWKKLNKLNPIG